MIGVYFSGTGNTKYCVEYVLNQLDSNGASYAIESEGVIAAAKSSDEIVLPIPYIILICRR